MNIIINGIGGRMGAELYRLAKEGYKGVTAVAGVDINDVALDMPTYKAWADVKEEADCIIDFSHHSSVTTLLPYAMEKGIAVVVATTGHTEEEKALIEKAAAVIPVFHSANMSLGVALLCELAKITAKTMSDAEIEIIEKHHNRKLDAPSGTALMLANAIKEIRDKATLVLGRSGQSKRTKEEIGIHAIRMGNIVGEHEVIVGTDSQTITLKHEAHSRALFAEGGITAAVYVAGRPAGLYNMQDMIGE